MMWIGRQATVKSGVTIGHGAVIGAHAVVTHDVAPYAIMAGVPARLVRMRFSAEIVAALLASRWWDYDLAPLRDAVDYCDVAGFIQLFEQKRSQGIVQPLYPVRHTMVNDDGVLRTRPFEG